YAILYHQKHELPPDVRELRNDVHDRLAEVIARAIEKRREARWGSVREMLDALEESTPLTLAPRRVGGGDETMRFVRPPLPAPAPAPVVALDHLAEELHAVEVHQRRLPVLARRTTVVATVSVAAIAAAIIFSRWKFPAPAPVNRAMLPVLQGDASKPAAAPA